MRSKGTLAATLCFSIAGLLYGYHQCGGTRTVHAAPSASTPAASAAPPAAPSVPPAPINDSCQVPCASDVACTGQDKCILGCCGDPKAPDRAEQASPVTRSGHELLTLLSAQQALAEDAQTVTAVGTRPLPDQSGCARIYSCSHGANTMAEFSAIMGVRWADLMGFRAGPLFPAQQRCLSAVAQDNEDVQYDHALRRRDEKGPAGGLRAIAGIRQRLLTRFTKAVTADDAIIDIADGGGQQDHYKVIRSYFLLGRALHIVQDSFSTIHTQRTGNDFEQLVQVNSYVCTPDAPPHPHETPGVLNLLNKDLRSSNGDVVRPSGCSKDELKCLKPEYVASVTASKQLWLAFKRARAAPPAQRATAAKRELTPYLDRWFKVPASVPHAPQPERPCSVDSLATIERRRTACLKMTGRGEGKGAPFNWDRSSFINIP